MSGPTVNEILDAAVKAVQEVCRVCGGAGSLETARAAHACGGDDSKCASECPVPEQALEECESCARNTAAIYLLLPRFQEKTS